MDRVISTPRYAFDPISEIRERSVSEIIRNYIPMGMKGLFYGDEKTFKTPVAVKIGIDVAMQNVTHHGDLSLPGLGYEILRHGAVRYIAAELPKGVHSRAREFIRARDPEADPEKVDFRVLSAKPDLTDPTDVDDLIKALDRSLSPGVIMRLIFVDTTVYCLGDADENHPSTVTKVYNAADRIIDHYEGGCSVIFIQHTGKNQYKGVRGSSNWENSIGFRMEFSASGNVRELVNDRTISFPAAAVIKCEKYKDGPHQQPIQYKTTRVPFSSYEIDPVDHDLKINPAEDSVLHLSVVPYSKLEASGGAKSKKREVLIQKIVKILGSFDNKRYVNYATLAAVADNLSLLQGNPKTRVNNFRKQVFRFMAKYPNELDKKFYEISRSSDGSKNYVFVSRPANSLVANKP